VAEGQDLSLEFGPRSEAGPNSGKEGSNAGAHIGARYQQRQVSSIASRSTEFLLGTVKLTRPAHGSPLEVNGPTRSASEHHRIPHQERLPPQQPVVSRPQQMSAQVPHVAVGRVDMALRQGEELLLERQYGRDQFCAGERGPARLRGPAIPMPQPKQSFTAVPKSGKTRFFTLPSADRDVPLLKRIDPRG
jgi:hypothetical protein